jgi:hypothetical protein
MRQLIHRLSPSLSLLCVPVTVKACVLQVHLRNCWIVPLAGHKQVADATPQESWRANAGAATLSRPRLLASCRLVIMPVGDAAAELCSLYSRMQQRLLWCQLPRHDASPMSDDSTMDWKVAELASAGHAYQALDLNHAAAAHVAVWSQCYEPLLLAMQQLLAGCSCDAPCSAVEENGTTGVAATSHSALSAEDAGRFVTSTVACARLFEYLISQGMPQTLSAVTGRLMASDRMSAAARAGEPANEGVWR